MNNKVFLLVVILGICFSARTQEKDKKPSVVPTISGYASFEAGQVVKGRGIGTPSEINRKWVQTGFVGLKADAKINEHFCILAAMEGEMANSFSFSSGAVDMYRETQTSRTRLNIKNAEGIYNFGNTDAVFIELEGGIFPYKYNQDVRNLGEYLFRSTPYPQFIVNVFDRPYANLAGFKIGNTLFKHFHQDVILTSERQDFPLMDYSLTYLSEYSIPGIVTIGSGISLHRIFPVNGSATTPNGDAINKYFRSISDSVGAYYSYAGTKMMVRLSIDPKCVLPKGVFGENDLKIYSEAALLGLDIPVDTSRCTPYYTNMSERMPLMLGFNFPVCSPACKSLLGFKLLDLLNGELEYFPNKYPNSFSKPFEAYKPLPEDDDPANKHTTLKWSLYAKRDFGNNFSVVFQMAQDHFIPVTFALAQGQTDRTDVLLRHGDWWWASKLQYTF